MAEIIVRNGNEVTLQVTLKLSGSLLEMENVILDGCNELGCVATAEALKKFDTDGSPLKWGEVKMTARSKDNKTYQTPYGSIQLERYVYQSPPRRQDLLPVGTPGADYPQCYAPICPTNIPQICGHECAVGLS